MQRMKKNKFLRIVCFGCLLWIFPGGKALSIHESNLSFSSAVQVDTLPVIPFLKDFLRHVQKYHPLSFQASLQPARAEAEQLKAKGSFDPIFEARTTQKYFDDKQYFSLAGGELKIPTWIGADIKTGYEVNRGSFLSEENSTPASGLLFGGISMPLGRGLLIDERRLGVKAAVLKIQAAKAKQQIEMNEVLFDASMSYWEWFRAFHTLETWKAAYLNATQRYQATLTTSASGERPMLDTLEARVQMQNLLIGKMEAEANWQKQSLQLNAFVWDDNLESYGSLTAIQPPVISVRTIPPPLEWASSDQSRFSHPYIDQLTFEAQEIELQKQWAVERRKPSVQLQYMPLAEAVGPSVWNQFSLNNYKWGLEVKLPVLFRKERADIQLAKIRAQENRFELADKKANLHSKVTASFAVWKNYQEQYQILETLVAQYKQLYEAEITLFISGESSLFMVNLREQTYLQSTLKWIDIAAKYNQALCQTHYFGGRMISLAE